MSSTPSKLRPTHSEAARAAAFAYSRRWASRALIGYLPIACLAAIGTNGLAAGILTAVVSTLVIVGGAFLVGMLVGGMMGGTRGVKSLVRLLEETIEENADTRSVVADLLKVGPAGVPALLRGVKLGDENCREAFDEMDVTVLPALVASAREPLARETAARIVTEDPDESLVLLRECRATSEDDYQRICVAGLLLRIVPGDEESLHVLTSHLDSTNLALRFAAVGALASSSANQPGIRSRLVAIARNSKEDPDVRRLAHGLLTNSGMNS